MPVIKRVGSSSNVRDTGIGNPSRVRDRSFGKISIVRDERVGNSMNAREKSVGNSNVHDKGVGNSNLRDKSVTTVMSVTKVWAIVVMCVADVNPAVMRQHLKKTIC